MRLVPLRVPRRLLGGAVLLALLVAAQWLGCASYSSRMRQFRERVARGELEQALAQVAAQSEPGDLLYHLERGLLLRYVGDPVASNAELGAAETRLADLYTISLSERSLTFLTNDEVEDYRGEVYEGSYLHYYRILNFLTLGDRSGAAVEARRLALRLETLAADDPEGRYANAFLEYWVGVILEAFGESNAALVAYRRAAEAWREGKVRGLAEGLPGLEEALVRTARASGIDLAEIAAGDLATLAVVPPAPGTGELLVVCELGWAPRKESEHLRLPILQSDPEWKGAEEARRAGPVLAERYRGYRREGTWGGSKTKIAYFLDVAIPVLVADRESVTRGCRIALESRTVAEEAPWPPVETCIVDDLAARVSAAFAAREPAVLAKTFARALLKYGAQRQARLHGGQLAGALANLAGVVTEKADTRSWLMLPAQVQVARMRLPAGEYRLQLTGFDQAGRSVETEVQEVEVREGRVGVVGWRVFR